MYYPVSQELIARELLARQSREKALTGQQIDPSRRGLIWAAMLLGSALPSVVAQFLGYNFGYLLPILQSAVLIILAVIADRSERLRVVLGFILAVAILRLNWSVIAPALAATAPIAQANSLLSIGGRLFLSRLLFALGMPLMLVTMAGLQISRRTLYLHRGNMAAMAKPEAILFFRKPIPWTRLAPILLIIFGVALPLFLYFTLRPELKSTTQLLSLLPWAFATATLNAASEEFQFRCIPLAQLRGIMPIRELLWLTSIFFGIGHYFGQPSGLVGVFMATIAGWLWGKSIIETRGVGWAFIIHTVQDVVIFYFLALSLTN